MFARIFATSLGVISAALCLSTAAAADEPPSGPPRPLNVLLISCDDLNNNLGCYGSSFIKSPNIDRLAARGIRFDRAYCQNPFCMPSRTSFLSGRRTGSSLKDVVWMPHYFHDHGYFTAALGKVAHGIGVTDEAVRWDVKEKEPKPAARPEDEDNPDANHQGGRVARRAVELMVERRDRPFFLGVGLEESHSGWRVPKKYYEMHPADKVVLPQEPPEHFQDIPAIARGFDQTTPAHDGWTDEQKRKRVADFQARYAFVDAQVEVLLDALDRLELWDSTIVVLAGDHGLHLGEHGYWGKRSLFEESARIPFLIAAPGVKGGQSSPRLVEHIDLYPTFAELCGLPVPAGVEATSFAPLLKDPQRAWKKAVFTQTERPLPGNTVKNPSEAQQALNEGRRQIIGRAVRTERYAYIEWGDEKVAQLYDHQTDPREYVNLASEPRHAELRAEMRRLLKAGWKAAVPE